MREYYVLSLKNSRRSDYYVWWGENDSGYTYDINQAGIYTEDRIISRGKYYCNKDTVAIPKETVQQLVTQKVALTTNQNFNILNFDIDSLDEY